MRQFLIHFLVLTLIGGGFAYAADSHAMTEADTPANTEFVKQTNSGHGDEGEHHAHHGCHYSAHLIGLISESASLKPIASRNSLTRLSKTYISRLSVPLRKPPRS